MRTSPRPSVPSGVLSRRALAATFGGKDRHRMNRTIAIVSVLAALSVAYFYTAPNLFPDDDDGLAAGLTMFILVVLASIVSAVVDGYHTHRWPHVVMRWLVVAAALGSLLPALAWAEEGTTVAVLVNDILNSVPVMLILIGVPAAFGGWLGWLVRGNGHQEPS
jgi:hypothetical protein